MSRTFEALTERRRTIHAEMTTLAQRASDENRVFTEDEQGRWALLEQEIRDLDSRRSQMHAADQRAEDERRAFEGLLAQRPTVRQPGNSEWADQMRSMLIERNPKPVELRTDRLTVFRPADVEQRDLVTTAPANYRPVSVQNQIWEHAVETSGVLRAGATVIQTPGGETLHLPRSTALSTAALVAEAAAIGESDPTLSTVALGAFKLGCLVQVSTELLTDSSVDLQAYLARETGQAIGVTVGNYLVNGTGTAQPRGVLADTTAGVTGPTGTATSFGTQATAGQGTDLLNSLYGSVAEPYLAGSPGFVARSATITAVRNLKTSAGDIVGSAYLASPPAPFYADGNVPAMAANAKSVLFGDWSRMVLRQAGPLRFESSVDWAFNADLVTFRCLLRMDSALVNVDSVKHFANSAT